MPSRILFTASLISCVSLCYGKEPQMINIVHPNIFPDYYDFVMELPQIWSQPSVTSIAEELCKVRAEAQFFIDEAMDYQTVALDRQLVISKIVNFYESIRAKVASGWVMGESYVKKSQVMLGLRIWNKEAAEYIDFDAIPCFIEEGGPAWHIADIFGTGTYYAVSRRPDEQQFKVVGLLEPVPRINQEVSNNKKELEQTFLKGQKNFEALQDGKQVLSALNNFDIIRICSGVFVAWSKKKDIPVPRTNNFRSLMGSKSLPQDMAIDLESSIEEEFPTNTEVTLIPCAMNEDFEKPQFYVSIDVESVGNAYVIEKKEGNVFSIFMYVEEIIALKQTEYYLTSTDSVAS